MIGSTEAPKVKPLKKFKSNNTSMLGKDKKKVVSSKASELKPKTKSSSSKTQKTKSVAVKEFKFI